MEGTKRLERKLGGMGFDEVSTHKKYGRRNNLSNISAISEFSIMEEEKVKKYFMNPSNLKIGVK